MILQQSLRRGESEKEGSEYEGGQMDNLQISDRCFLDPRWQHSSMSGEGVPITLRSLWLSKASRVRVS